MLNKIFNEDCLIGMQKIPDGSIDMILADLPFGITDAKHDVKIPLLPLWSEYKRIIKPNGAILLFGVGIFCAELMISNPKMYKYEWIWEKNNATGFLFSHSRPLRAHENILVFYKKPPTYNPQFVEGKPYTKYRKKLNTENYIIRKNYYAVNDGKRYPRSVLRYKTVNASGKGHTVHPTQKPVDLLEYLIKTYTNEGETVLDNCIGSGSTAVACVNTNRNFIGFETVEKYCEIARKRIEEALKLKQ